MTFSTSTITGEFRQYLPDLTTPRFATMQQQDAHAYVSDFKCNKNPPWLHALYQHWLKLLAEPYKGITNDGNVRPGLFSLQNEEFPIQDVVAATKKVLDQMNESQRAKSMLHIDSPEWRTWSNPEFLLSNKGIRLDEIEESLRDAVLEVLRLSLSREGFDKAISAMRINGFLGELVHGEAVCNEFSYNFVVFGDVSTTKPWGFSFYGHHLCLNLFFYSSQVVISPWFTGAEPNEIDTGHYAGTKILQREDHLGLQLMQSLPAEQQTMAQSYKLLRDPSMPPGRWNRDDQRHLCGAYRDNRIVPYEGILVSSMAPEQIKLVEDILNEFLLYLPGRAREIRLAQIREFFSETYFCWIGGFGNQDAFYYRIQSPVIIVEFDHHSGVFLNNSEPARFHIHTLLRTPNAGDYGKALLPLIPGEDQAFVWDDEKAREGSRSQGYQEK